MSRYFVWTVSCYVTWVSCQRLVILDHGTGRWSQCHDVTTSHCWAQAPSTQLYWWQSLRWKENTEMRLVRKSWDVGWRWLLWGLVSVDIARRVSKLSQHVTCCWASFQCPQRTCRWRCKTVAETDLNRPMMRCHDALKQVTVSQCTQALLGSCAPNLRVGDFTHTHNEVLYDRQINSSKQSNSNIDKKIQKIFHDENKVY